MSEFNEVAAFEMQYAFDNNGVMTCFLIDKEWLIMCALNPAKIKYFHPMDPTAKSIIGTRIDRYAWAIMADDGWILLGANDCFRGKETVMASNQMWAVGHQVEDTPSKFEGEQYIHLRLQVSAVELIYQNAVLMMRLKKPTMEEVQKFYAVDLTPRGGWSLYQENDVVGMVAVKKEEDASNVAEM